MKKIFLNLALTCVALASFQAIAQTPDTEKKTVISEKVTKKSKVRISHTGYSETAKAKTLEKFKAVLESSNVGNVELFDGSATKYKDTSELDSLELGVIEVNAPISGLISSINRETSLDILTLPYLFNVFFMVSLNISLSIKLKLYFIIPQLLFIFLFYLIILYYYFY